VTAAQETGFFRISASAAGQGAPFYSRILTGVIPAFHGPVNRLDFHQFLCRFCAVFNTARNS